MSESRAPTPGGSGLRRHRTRLLAALAIATALWIAGSLALSALRQRRAAQNAFPTVDGVLPVRGISQPLEVIRDARGVPHVEAASDADAYFGLGFAHAQDRLAQMIWLRHSARGRSAELLGEEGLAADRTARTLGIARHADAQAERLDAPTRSALAAYSAGVNAMLARIRAGNAALPVALQGLELDLEPWRPADAIAVVKLLAWGLGGSLDASLVLSDLIEHLGGFAARPYFPEGEAPAVAAPASREARVQRPRSGPAGGFADPLRAALGLRGRSIGSSAWAVAGRLTASGRPLVAGDSHFETTAPALLYEAHLRGGGLDVAGATIPGVPVVWTGHNRRVAWASAHARAVVSDLYVETLSPRDPSLHHDGGRWRKLEERVERIRVRGRGEEELRVRETRRGPLVNALLDGEREPLSLAWTGALPGDGVSALLRAARAGSAAELRAALERHHEPVLAVAYAGVEGGGGVQLAGALPRRTAATGLGGGGGRTNAPPPFPPPPPLPPPLLPPPPRTELYEWRGVLPFDALPQLSLDAGRGWVIAADAPLAGGTEASRVEWLWRSGERAARIDALLRRASAEGPLEVRSLAALQGDQRAESAKALAEQALVLAGDAAALGAEAREMARVLHAWEGDTGAQSVGAAVYHVFLERLTEEILAPELGPELLRRYRALPQADLTGIVAARVRAAVAERAQQEPEALRVADAVRRSLRESWLWLAVQAGPNREKWAWGRLHSLRFRPLGPAVRLADAGEGLGPFPYGGGALTVAVGEYDRNRPFEVRVASIYRFAVDTAALEQALTSLAPGQSEHPDHPHRADGIARWIEGEPRLLLTSKLLIEEAARARLVLEPER